MRTLAINSEREERRAFIISSFIKCMSEGCEYSISRQHWYL